MQGRSDFMFRWLDRFKCEHDYVIIAKFDNPYLDQYGRLNHAHVYTLFCPKCDKEKNMYAEDYKKKMKIKEVKENYKFGHEND